MSKIAKIEEWLEKSGFPLELKVAKLFSKAGFGVGQSIFYEDPITEKLRETDILAYRTESINDVWVNLTFVIECKKSLDKPWISFMNDQVMNLTKNESPILATKNGHDLLKEIIKNSNYKSPLIFPDLKKIGYSVIRAFNDGKDMAYSATQTTLSAAEFFISKSNDSDKKFMNFYLPIIVVEGELYEATLGKKENIELKEVSETKISTTKSFADNSSTFISITTMDNLDSFAHNLSKDCDEFYSKYKKELNLITEKYPSNSKMFIF